MFSFFTDYEKEANELVKILNISSGNIIADVGSGDGEMTLIFSRTVGEKGMVYSVEIDSDRLGYLRSKIKKSQLENIVLVKSSENSIKLPERSCDVVLVRTAYHHFTLPEKINESVYRALKPNGKLAVIDFTPSILSWAWAPKGIPRNRGGHGMPKDLLVEEVAKAGMKVENKFEKWFGTNYCYIFSR